MNILKVLCLAALLLAGAPAAGREVRSFQDLKFSGIAKQGAEPSCAVASLVSILNHDFGRSFVEGDIWLRYLAELEPEQREIAMRDGLSIADIVALAKQLGFQAHAVRIPLLGLLQVGKPAIVYMERGGRVPYRHFLVFDQVQGTRVNLRDPAAGARKVHIEHFLLDWRGHAIFITAP